MTIVGIGRSYDNKNHLQFDEFEFHAMDTSDVALLIVLGTADADATSFENIVSAARLIGPVDWQSTTDGIRGAVERALCDGLVVAIDDAHGVAPALRTTGRGRREAAVLLRQPMPRADAGGTGTAGIVL